MSSTGGKQIDLISKALGKPYSLFQDPYHVGQDAQKYGEPLSANPWKGRLGVDIEFFAKEWRRGWIEAEQFGCRS